MAKSRETYADECQEDVRNFPNFPGAQGREVVSIKSPEGPLVPREGGK